MTPSYKKKWTHCIIFSINPKMKPNKKKGVVFSRVSFFLFLMWEFPVKKYLKSVPKVEQGKKNLKIAKNDI